MDNAYRKKSVCAAIMVLRLFLDDGGCCFAACLILVGLMVDKRKSTTSTDLKYKRERESQVSSSVACWSKGTHRYGYCYSRQALSYKYEPSIYLYI